MVSFSPSGSRWLSLQGLSEMGAPTLVSLGQASRAPACVCTSPISWLALPHTQPRLCHLLSLRRVSACFKVPHLCEQGPRQGPPPSSPGAPHPSPGSAPRGGLPLAVWVPVNWEVRWANPGGGSGPGGSVLPHDPPCSDRGFQKAGGLQREEGEGVTVWDGGSRGRGTGDRPRDVFKTGWESTDPPCLLCAVWAGEAGPSAPSWVRSVCRAAQPESAPARLQATPCVGRCAVAGRVLWTGLGCSGPGWRVLTSGCFRHLVGSEGEAQPLHHSPIPSSSGAAGRGGPGVFQPPPPALEAGAASGGRGCWAPRGPLWLSAPVTVTSQTGTGAAGRREYPAWLLSLPLGVAAGSAREPTWAPVSVRAFRQPVMGFRGRECGRGFQACFSL